MFLLSNSACWCPQVAVARLFSSLDAPRTHHDPANVATGLGSQIHPFDSMCFLRSPHHNLHSVTTWPKFFGGPCPVVLSGATFEGPNVSCNKTCGNRSCVSILALLNLATRRRWQLDKVGHLVMYSQLPRCKEPAFEGLLWKRQQTAPQILLQSLLRNTN